MTDINEKQQTRSAHTRPNHEMIFSVLLTAIAVGLAYVWWKARVRGPIILFYLQFICDHNSILQFDASPQPGPNEPPIVGSLPVLGCIGSFLTDAVGLLHRSYAKV